MAPYVVLSIVLELKFYLTNYVARRDDNTFVFEHDGKHIPLSLECSARQQTEYAWIRSSTQVTLKERESRPGQSAFHRRCLLESEKR